jgi:hypothetical protein
VAACTVLPCVPDTTTTTTTSTTTTSTLPCISTSGCFCDTGDGTIHDTCTGLQWEKKTGTYVPGPGICTTPESCPDPHDVNNAYQWSSTGTAADGTLFTNFLARLNAGSGFAGHTDWRIPTVAGCCGIPTGEPAELESILDPAAPGCGVTPYLPCINPIFGPTAAGNYGVYWSSTSEPVGGGSIFAWFADFGYGTLGAFGTNNFDLARGVRTGS